MSILILSILIIAPPGPLRDGLQALLATVAPVAVAGSMAEVAALAAARQGPPQLLVCEESCLDESCLRHPLCATQAENAGVWPQVPRLVLVEQMPSGVGGQRTATTLAITWVVKGCPAAKLLAMVQRLLTHSRIDRSGIDRKESYHE